MKQTAKEQADKFIPALGCTVDEYNKEIDEAEAEIDAGEFNTDEEVKGMFKEWDKKHQNLPGDKFVPELGCTIDEYNREIDEAEAEIDAGEFYTQQEMEKRIAGWKDKVRNM